MKDTSFIDWNIGFLQSCSANYREGVVNAFRIGNLSEEKISQGFAIAAGRNYPEVLKTIVQCNKENTINTKVAFISACTNGHIQCIKYLLKESGLDTDIYQQDSLGLINAYLGKHLDVVNYFFDEMNFNLNEKSIALMNKLLTPQERAELLKIQETKDLYNKLQEDFSVSPKERKKLKI